MKNRLLASVLCLLMVLLFVLGLTACGECEHQWGDWTVSKNATCTEEGTKEHKCTECGETETAKIDALGHDWNAATCTAPKTCKTCSATEGSVGSHAYTVETVKDEALKTAATCTSAAVYYKSCACGAISTNDADTFTSGSPIAHSFVNEVVKAEALKSEATATMDAIYYKSCACGAISTNEEDTFNLHVYNQETVKDEALKSAATCTNAAVYHKSCACGAVSASDEDVFTIGSPAPHTYDKEVVKEETLKAEATCESAAVYYKSCACGAVSESEADTFTSGDPIAHTYDQEIVSDDTLKTEATCKSAAVYYKSCDCGAISESDNETFTSGATAPHSYSSTTTPATCESPAIIVYLCDCGDTYSDYDGDKLGHDISGVVPTEKLVEGCQYILVYECKRQGCGADVDGETVYHHNHIASIDKAATCTEDGLKVFKCACGDELEPEVIEHDPTGHKWVLGTVSQEGKRIDECSVCHETKSVTVYDGNTTGSTNASDLKDTEIELNDANINLGSDVVDKIGDQKISVSADKLTGDDRKNIGLSEDALGQVGDNPIYNFTISNGQENISDFGENNYVTITLPYELKPGEDVDSIAIWFISDKCQKEDCDNGDHCEDASHRLVSINATYNNGFVTFKTNHFSYYTVTKLTPAERCELYGHNYSVQHVEGSCTQDSYDRYVCVRCHDKYVDNYVSAPGHKYTVKTNEASCTEHGSVVYDCDNCDHSYSTKILAKGHDWDVKTEESTCAVNGYTKYDCKNCSEEYTVTHAKAAHSYSKTVVDPTCEKAGYTLYDCDGCDHSYTDKFVSALGHSYEVSAWEWADDYKSATLTLVCVNDEEHTKTLSASIGTKIINGNCSTFVKTIYTAAVSYNGVVYTDEQFTEEGNPNHVFSEDWKHDANAHWHECICTERTDVTPHTFENAAITKQPTCNQQGEETSYCVCGEKKVVSVPATGEHDYENGVCKNCGAENAGNYYLNLVNSWKNFKGFAIKIENLSFEVREEESTLIDSFSLMGSIKQLDVTELYLFYEDGEFSGAATGSIVIFNGPIRDENAVCNFKAVISDGYAYASVDYGREGSTKVRNVKISVDDLIDTMLEEMSYPEASASTVALDLITETVLPAIEAFIEFNADDADAILESLFNIIFTFEKQEDGSYVATLDYDKLYALNENLATKPIAEVIDVYFGEGAFDSIIELMLEIFDLEISKIPAYLEEHGFETDDIIEKINELAVNAGNTDFDLLEMLNSADYTGVTLGMIIFEEEKDAYIKNINSAVEMLKETALYSMFGENVDADEIKEGVDSIVEFIAGKIVVSFSTDYSGMLTAVNFAVDNFSMPYEDTEISLTVSVEILINETIDVTWSDIIDEIEKNIIELDEELLTESNGSYVNYGYYGTVMYNGVEYYYDDAMSLVVYEADYSNIYGVYYFEDCEGWLEYSYAFGEKRYTFILITIEVDGEDVSLIVNEGSDLVCELVETDTGFKAIYSDGTEKDLEINFSDIMASGDYNALYKALCLGAFEKPVYTVEKFGTSVDFYYNPTTKEFSDESHHSYIYKYELEGDLCEDGCTVYITCENCDLDEVSNRYHCEYESAEIDLSQYHACGGILMYEKCAVCGNTGYFDIADMSCHLNRMNREDIVDANGKVVGFSITNSCEKCGLAFTESEWKEYTSTCEYVVYDVDVLSIGGKDIVRRIIKGYGISHNYEENYVFNGNGCEDGYTLTRHCTLCGETHVIQSAGHGYEYRSVDLHELGFCGGYIEEAFCPACNMIHYSNIFAECWFEYYGENEDGFDIYKCHNCNTERYSMYEYGEKNEECMREATRTEYFYRDGELIYSYITTYYSSEHNWEFEYEVPTGSCEDGYIVYMTCIDCKMQDYKEGYWHETIEIDRVDLSKLGVCYGEFVYRTCPCGEYKDFYIDSCYDLWNEEKRFDEELGAVVNVELRSCSECGLVYQRSSYSLADENSCIATSVVNVLITVNGNLIFDETYTFTEEAHQNKITATLVKGEGSSCHDGVIFTHKCEKCGTEKTEQIDWHENYEIAVIDLKELGSTCGGYLVLEGCACGEFSNLQREHCYCDFGEPEHSAVWIENIITESQPTINGYYYLQNYAYTYICAVTDPEPCQMNLRYANYWLKVDGQCRIAEYVTWQYYNRATGEYEDILTYATGSSQPYHSYVDSSDNSGINKKLDCSVCGSYYYENYYFDETGFKTKYEVKVQNNVATTYENKYSEKVVEFARNMNGDEYVCREYYKVIYPTGDEYEREEINREESYEGPFGENGIRNISERRETGGFYSRTEEAYVFYKGNRYEIYYYSENAEYWERREFTYSFDGGCFVTEKYSSSYDKNYEETRPACKVGEYVTIQEATCSQSGIYAYKCAVCDSIYDTHEESPRDHQWEWDDNSGIWHCWMCGLENANGSSGNIIMEDMTEKYGNGENYVVGYYVHKEMMFTYYVSLVFDNGEEKFVEGIDVFEIDGLRAFAFSKAYVAEFAAANGYTDYEVRFTFVPEYADGSFDYALTFTEKTANNQKPSGDDYYGK